MDWIINNWYIIVGLLAVVLMVVYLVVKFFCLPTDKQIEKVKEWLKYAVTQAEKALGSGTGQLKLRYVYDMFVQRFPWLSRVVTFDYFEMLVDEALKWLELQLASNKNIKEFVDESN